MPTKPTYDELEQEIQFLRQQVEELEHVKNEQQVLGKIFHNIVDKLPALIFWKDRYNRIIGFNKAYSESLGKDPKDIQNKSIQELFPEVDAEKFYSADIEVMQTGLPVFNIMEETTRNGKHVWLQTDKVPFWNEEGEIVGVVGISTDVTKLKIYEKKLMSAQKQLREANQQLESRVNKRTEELRKTNKELSRMNGELDNFIYAASHDLRSPISNLEGLMDILKSNVADKLDGPEMKIIEMMTRSITKFKSTIQDLTEITRVQKDLEEMAEDVSFEQQLTDVKIDVQHMINESGAEITTDFQVPSIHYFRKNLRSIIYNFVSNAIKYRHPDRKPDIRLSTTLEKGRVVLRISDNGLGLNPDQQSKLFAMFKRMHNHVEGSGIGLYMVKKIVENYGGTIQVQSEENKGSTFTVTFEAVE
ncbi:MAG: PAS domain-containing sensor histidine kinase [Bacteroidia bacterium]